MAGTGTLINTGAVIAGGLVGHFAGRLFKEEQQDSITVVCGISVLFIAIAGAMEGMLQITSSGTEEGAALTSGRSMFIVLCLAIGTVIGEILLFIILWAVWLAPACFFQTNRESEREEYITNACRQRCLSLIKKRGK